MKRLVRTALALAFLVAGRLAAPAAADVPLPPMATRAACAAPLDATKVDGDPNAVVVRVLDWVGAFSGTLTAYGHDRTWTGTLGQSAMVRKRYGGVERSVTLRADGPIEGVTFTPSWTECTLYSGVRSRNGYDAPDVERPVLALANPQPIEPANCAAPFRSATVLRAFEPQTPAMAAQQGIQGTVRVAVWLDEHGVPQFTRVVASPSPIVDRAALDAARRSTYAGAIFRCHPVPAGYQFAVDFAS